MNPCPSVTYRLPPQSCDVPARARFRQKWTPESCNETPLPQLSNHKDSDGLQKSQDNPQISRKWAKSAPRWPQILNLGACGCFLRRRKCSPFFKRAHTGPKASPYLLLRPKSSRATLVIKIDRGHLGQTWGHLGAILALLGNFRAVLGSSWGPKRAQNGPFNLSNFQTFFQTFKLSNCRDP